MLTSKIFNKYKTVQEKAKEVLLKIIPYINKNSTEQSISKKCKELLRNKGIIETWYYEVHAFVLLGSRSCLSVSGSEYTASGEKAGLYNLITIDLSPLEGNVWGDCARSFAVQNGIVESKDLSDEFLLGIKFENNLHRHLMEYVTMETTFENLYFHMNDYIAENGFENLDFCGNLGHSIAESMGDRIYIEAGNKTKISIADFFTFEPHIKQKNERWGFKHENIYFFDESGKIKEL